VGTDLAERTALGEELRFLARRHPRASWADHPRLGELARYWLARHALFRELDEILRTGSEAALAEAIEAAAFKPWLARHLQTLLWQLEGHHQVEDLHYFPVFRRAEPRLAWGFELLERDHDSLHTSLGDLAAHANRVLAQDGADRAHFRAGLARFHDAQATLGRQLRRHLDDEEDLVVPLLIERGEDVLHGGTPAGPQG
jgi:hemerythrin-like domain-containing protein